MAKKNPVDDFEYWYNNDYLLSRSNYSPLVFSRNRTAEARFQRIKEIALKFMVSMRIALDYLNFANLIIKKYNEERFK